MTDARKAQTAFAAKYVDRQWRVVRGSEITPKAYKKEFDAAQAADRLERESKIVDRNCMCCRIKFQSEGNNNRMCKTCRVKSDPMGDCVSVTLR